MNKTNQNIAKKSHVITFIKGFMLVFIFYLQIKTFMMFWYNVNNFMRLFGIAVELFKVFISIYMIYNIKNISYKFLWVILLIIFPLPAIILYWFFGNLKLQRKLKTNIIKEDDKLQGIIKFQEELYENIKKESNLKYNQIKFLQNTTKLPLYENSNAVFFNTGESFFEDIIENIILAKEYVFLQWYVIIKGNMWDRLYNILKNKALEGVKIYLICDGMIPLQERPDNFKNELKSSKIELGIFNPINFNISSYFNHRGHVKMVVIDGKYSYVGGINIGDEYINLYERYGHWKDSGIKIEGEAVKTHVAMFIKNWNICKNTKLLDYNNYISSKKNSYGKNKGYILPFADGPSNHNNPVKGIYINILNTAKKYVYITTPYLALDSELILALTNAARSGIDIRIIVPKIPDKKLVYTITQSFYTTLLESGVKIYEYDPGFIHSKVLVSDDELSLVGTVNLNFRSFLLDFESCNWTYKTGIENIIKDDFIKTKEKSTEIKLESWKNNRKIRRSIDKLLMAFSPLV